MALMSGHTTGMKYDEKLGRSLVDNEEGFISRCGARSASTDIAFLDAGHTSEDYQNVLKRNLLPIGNILGWKNWKVVQDNVSIYTSHSTTTWFTQNQVTVIDGPAISPDLNPMDKPLGSTCTGVRVSPIVRLWDLGL